MPNHLAAVEQINKNISADPKGFITACEGAFSNKVTAVADSIADLPGNRLVMLAGPSSSGKTTTARLLAEEFARRGRFALTVSLDDFYLGRDVPFKFEDGTPDYETVQSLDVPYIKVCLQSLMKTGRCMLPRFSFQTGMREETLIETSIEKDDIIIVEGLHALNPLITAALDADSLSRLYVSVSTRLTQENDVLFSKRELRFIRRLVRDYQFRNSSVDHTFYLWNGVRKGEDRYLFPFSPLAEIRIDSIHYYEPCAFKSFAVPLLSQVAPDNKYFPVAQTILEKFDCFPAIDRSLIPRGSLLREFIG